MIQFNIVDVVTIPRVVGAKYPNPENLPWIVPMFPRYENFDQRLTATMKVSIPDNSRIEPPPFRDDFIAVHQTECSCSLRNIFPGPLLYARGS